MAAVSISRLSRLAKHTVPPGESMKSYSADNTSLTLLQRARDNDQSAWRILNEVYGPVVEKWCLRAGVSHEDTKDLTQDVFRVVAAHLQGFRRDQAGQSFRRWLKTITINLAFNHFRDLSHKPRAQGGTDHQLSLEQLPECALEESDDDIRQEQIEVFQRALRVIQNDFEPDTWTAFWRTKINDESTEAVAESLGKHPKAVRQARSRVLKRLRDEFAGLIDFDKA